MDTPSTPPMRRRTRTPISGLSAGRRLNRLIVDDVNPATFARNPQFIIRLPNGSVASTFVPPVDCEPPKPPELAVPVGPDPASEASATIIFRLPHWKLKCPFASV